MDASQYKDYILTLLFMKYVSDKYEGKPDAVIEVPKGGSFSDMVKLKGDKEIGDKINKIIAKLAKANELVDVIDEADFNDESKLGRGKEMQDRLSKLVAIIDGLDFRANRPEGDDLLGDAYEYLMRNFATESGKSKGNFYTPAEVSRIMSKIIGIGKQTRPDHTIYDPTCGSGSLLLKGADEAPNGITIYGQEKDNATWALARMNMILHSHVTAEIWHDNTLASPHFKDKNGGLMLFNFAVANPPFSDKGWTSGITPDKDVFGRFDGYGVPPNKNGDYAYLLHVIKSLKSKGKGAIILPHGVLFRGNVEATIRRNIIKKGLIKGIIGLPANLFYGTGIPACIVVIDKENSQARTGIFMIDASKGFMKDGNKNRLRSQDLHKIVDVFNRQIEVPGFSRMVPVAEIANPSNDYNLNILRYIDSSDQEDIHDLNAHLNGGIPNRDIDDLQKYWDVFPSLRAELFKRGRSGYSLPRIEATEVKPTILAHDEFKAFSRKVSGVFNKWRETHSQMLNRLKKDIKPRDVINTLSEDLLERFAKVDLLSRYDVYQRLMDYWAEVMQDDVYLISAEGWVDSAKPRGIIDDKEKKLKETPDLIVKKKKYKMDLIPPGLIVDRYLTAERDVIDKLQVKHDAAASELEGYVEEHSGEGGLLEDAANDKGNVVKGSVNARLKEIKGEPDSDEERDALKQCLKLIEAESDAGKAVKDAQADLDEKILAKYSKLSEKDIKSLVVDDKCFAAVYAAIGDEIQKLTQGLVSRVKELEERYAHPMPELEKEVAELTKSVSKNLKKMGLEW